MKLDILTLGKRKVLSNLGKSTSRNFSSIRDNFPKYSELKYNLGKTTSYIFNCKVENFPKYSENITWGKPQVIFLL
jgi:hypothetical protein